jgi:hypothetical protein
MTAGSRTNPGSKLASKAIKIGSRAGVLRRREPTCFSSATDDEVGGDQSAIPARDVRAADLQEEMAEQRFSGPSAPTKTAATQRTSQRAERAIEHCERKRAEQSDTVGVDL